RLDDRRSADVCDRRGTELPLAADMMAAPAPAIGQLSFRCLGCGAAIDLPSRPVQPLSCQSCTRVYAVDGGIVMLDDGPAQPDPSQPNDYSVLIETEPKHFWFPARNRLIRATLEETLGSLAGRSVVDIGCGTGFVLAELDRAGM